MTSRRLLMVVLSASWLCGGWWTSSVLAQVPEYQPQVMEGDRPYGFARPQEQASQTMTPPPQQMTPYGAPTPTSTEPYPSTSATNPASLEKSPLLAGDTSASQSLYNNTPPNNNPTVLDNARPLDTNAILERTLNSDEIWSWHLLPTGLMYKSYLAGGKEPRMGSQWVHLRGQGWLWDVTLGGRVGLLRYGTDNDLWPQGWQLDFEGAAFPRLNLEHERDVDCVDFRAGMPLTFRQGPAEFKIGYYHLSSHIGDEFLVRNPGYTRINYVRESTVAGFAVYLNPSVRLYSEAGWAFYTDGGAEPWEFQFGADISPPEPTGGFGAPFFAVNAHLRQENDFGGNFTVQSGWQWRGRTGHLLRVGMQYFNGMSDQYQFFDRFEEQIGLGLWYDF